MKIPGAGWEIEGKILFCDFHHLDTIEDGVYFQDKKIDILVELYGGLITPDILFHFKAGNRQVLYGPIIRLLSNKLSMVLLSENEDSEDFSPSERAVIKKYIPWARKLVPGAVSYRGGRGVPNTMLFSADSPSVPHMQVVGYG